MREAYYGEFSEATCRISIDIILIQCRKYVRQKYGLQKPKVDTLGVPSTPGKAIVTQAATPASSQALKWLFKLYPESAISIEIVDPRSADRNFVVCGRADWALGYGSNDEDGALLVALEAKRRSEFISGESQLIAYLAILRELSRNAGKRNLITQGVYSDGTRFAFICIKHDCSVEESPTYDTQAAGGLQMVFSFIVAMLETAMKSTSTATPTKPGAQQDKEIQNLEDEAWGMVRKLMDES